MSDDATPILGSHIKYFLICGHFYVASFHQFCGATVNGGNGNRSRNGNRNGNGNGKGSSKLLVVQLKMEEIYGWYGP